MPRYKLIVEYDGTGFVGWQHQANGRSVQQALEEAVQGFSGETVRVHGAGRTDAGVHALAQCCHIDLDRPFPPDTIRDALNAHLRPERVAVRAAALVAPDFDARRDATARIYRYVIVNRRSPPVLAAKRAWHVAQALDADAMRSAAVRLEGSHDFTSFRAAQCQARSPVRTLEYLTVTRREEEVTIEARARSFLHNQMRAMVGTLAEVGTGRRAADEMSAILDARDRQDAGPNAPSWGLYLVAVIYPA